jgi:hypothetical protein
VLTIDKIECEVENNAPDFITVEKDEPTMAIDFKNTNLSIPELSSTFNLTFHRHIDAEERVLLQTEFECIWFDIRMEEVKDLWVADLNFMIESEHPRYLAYYISVLDHHFEWLQSDMQTDEVKTMSLTKKKFKAPLISGKERYTASEVIRCADMISRAVRKVDLRTGGAYVKFNTDKGRLESLIVGMADKLGYSVERITQDEIEQLEAAGQRVSHSFSLKKNY